MEGAENIKMKQKKVSLLGAGNLAHFMGQRLSDSEAFTLHRLYARRTLEAKALQKLIGGQVVVKPEEVAEGSDIMIFALPDDLLTDFSKVFTGFKGVKIHGAGTRSYSVLGKERVGVIWPLYSLNKHDLPREKDLPLFYEASDKSTNTVVQALALAMSSNCYSAGLEQRLELHLSAVFVNNFVNHLMAITQERMIGEAFPFKEALGPIIKETIDSAMKGSAKSYQTGPAIRHDEQTIQKHLTLLKEHPEWQNIYEAITLSIQKKYPKK